MVEKSGAEAKDMFLAINLDPKVVDSIIKNKKVTKRLSDILI